MNIYTLLGIGYNIDSALQIINDYTLNQLINLNI